MILLPFDLILTVGAAAAVFALGLLVWLRNRGAVGNQLYSLVSISLATWTSADWILHLVSTAFVSEALAWKLFFYLTVSFGPALGMHVSAYLTRRMFGRSGFFVYGACFAAFLCTSFGFLAPLWKAAYAARWFLTVGAFFTLTLYVGALLFVSMGLYPVIVSASTGILERRRATYGLVILLPYLISGGMQMVTGPIPTGFFLPLLAVCFLVLSLLAFIRASFLDVQLSALEALFLFLTAFAVIMLLRSRGLAEAVSVAFGSFSVGVFALLAITTVRGERRKRLILEETNRQLRKLEHARNDFVDMVSHQLRSPLGGIRASASMLVAGDYGPLPEKARATASLIQDSATRLLSLAETFLNASRLEIGKYRSQRIPTNVPSEIGQAVVEMTRFAESKGIALRTVWPDDFPLSILVDQSVLENALFNLIDNALKYSTRGSVEIHAHLEAGMLVVEVRDMGEGMTPAEIGELFKKFHRGKHGHLHDQDGTGLGLYVVKELVEAAGGKIWAMSDGPGKGSAFTFTLPYDPVSSDVLTG